MGKYDYSYTREQVEEVLDRLRNCIEHENFQISMGENRRENANFRAQYGLVTDTLVAEKLMEIKVQDFCGSVISENEVYRGDKLYVFAPKLLLTEAVTGRQQAVAMYVKFDIIEQLFYDQTVVVSFHRLNGQIRYCFKRGE